MSQNNKNDSLLAKIRGGAIGLIIGAGVVVMALICWRRFRYGPSCRFSLVHVDSLQLRMQS
jgi:hypothetical protein